MHVPVCTSTPKYAHVEADHPKIRHSAEITAIFGMPDTNEIHNGIQRPGQCRLLSDGRKLHHKHTAAPTR